MGVEFTIFYIFILTFIIEYFMLPYIILRNHKEFSFNIVNFFLSIIVCSLFSLVEILIYDIEHNVISYKIYIILICIAILAIYFYKRRYGVNASQYILTMNQRNQNDIELSEDLMYRIQNYKELDEKNYNILELAENIINVRSNELSIFKNILYN